MPLMHQNGYEFLKKFPGVMCENTSKCAKMGINFSKIFREWLEKIPQNAPKCISILQQFSRGDVWKTQNMPKFISNYSSGNVCKYLKMRQNGYQFFKNVPGVTREITSKCSKMDINFFLISREKSQNMPKLI